MKCTGQNFQVQFIPCRHDVNVSLSSSAILEFSRSAPSAPSVAAQPRTTCQFFNHFIPPDLQ